MIFKGWKWMPYLFAFQCVALANESKEIASLSIKPLTCMVKRMGDNCKMTVKVSWRTTRAIDSCLYQNKTQLICWQGQNNITTKLDIVLSENMEFTLRSKTDVLARQLVSVNGSQPQKYRRRLRADWSLF